MSDIRGIVQKRRRRRAQSRSGAQRLVRWLVGAVLIFAGLNVLTGLLGLGTVVSVYAYYSEQLPEPGLVRVGTDQFQTTRLYDRTGQHLLYEVIDPLGGDRTWVNLSNIPQDLRNATIAIEDKSFYQNPGYDTGGIARAMFNDLIGEPVQGGSSITQQLVKNVLIEPSERTQLTFDRKLKELVLASRISQKYSKDQILEWYLNTNFYGNLAYGVEAAARVYFGKPAGELTIAESAMLAAIPQSPSLNPIDNFPQAKERQKLVLGAMVAQGYITQEQADIAYAAQLNIQAPEQRFNLLAPHFAIAARKQLEDMFGSDLVYRGGLVVYTTLDYPLFLQAECASRSYVARLSGQPPDTVVPASDGTECTAASYLHPLPQEEQNKDHHVDNASVVVIDEQTGEVLAIVGSLDYYNAAIDGNYNVAFAERQPGSTFKPFTYLTAFEQGYTPATMTLDVRTAFDIGSNEPYVPENFDRQFHGPQSIRSALANSYNVPAVEVLNWLGVDNVIRTAHIMGIDTLDKGRNQYGLSLTLGGGEVTLYDLTYAYSVFGDMGVMHGRPTPEDLRRPGFRTLDPTLILRVEDNDGNILWEYGKGNTFSSSSVVDPSLAYLMNDILSDDVSRRPSVGTDSALELDRPAAVKTGTTNDFRDNWTVGYTPQLVTGVWVGNTDNSQMTDMPAILGAAPIWNAVMHYAHQDLPVLTWQRPPDIVEMTVCQVSGLLPTPFCPTRQEIFKRGTEPTTPDNVWQQFAINRDTGLLATVYTPPDRVDQHVYEILPPEAADWVRDSNLAQPPTAYDTLNAPVTTGNVVITDPKPFSYVRGPLALHGTAQDPQFERYRLDYGKGLNPDHWQQIGGDLLTSVSDGQLGVWDTSSLDGLYSLRLTVIRNDASIQQVVIQVTVDNTPPSIHLLQPNDGQKYQVSDEFVSIQPLITDNVSMSKVEFYVDGKLIATSTISPYNERWIITTPGTHTIQLKAYDTAGNVATGPLITIQVAP